MITTDFYTIPGCSLVKFSEHCGRIAAKKIENFVNRGKAKSTNKQVGFLVNKQSFAANKLKSVSDTTRKQSDKGNFFQFSPCDQEEITSLAILILAQNNAFPDYLGPYTVSKKIIDQIKEAIKGRDGLELNRYRNKRKIQMGIRGESVAGIMDCDIASLPELHDRLLQTPYTETQEKIKFAMTQKTEAVEICLQAFHQSEGKREWKSMLKKDMDFFQSLWDNNATGHGKNRTAYLMERSRFLDRLREGFHTAKQSEKSEFKSFAELAEIF